MRLWRLRLRWSVYGGYAYGGQSRGCGGWAREESSGQGGCDTVVIVVGKARRAMPTDSKAPTLCSPSVCSLSLFSASSTSYFLAVVIFSAWNYLRDCGGDCGEKSTLCESLDFPTFWALSRLPSTNCPFFSAFSSQPLIFFASCDRLPLTLRLSASFVLIHTFLAITCQSL